MRFIKYNLKLYYVPYPLKKFIMYESYLLEMKIVLFVKVHKHEYFMNFDIFDSKCSLVCGIKSCTLSFFIAVYWTQRISFSGAISRVMMARTSGPDQHSRIHFFDNSSSRSSTRYDS